MQEIQIETYNTMPKREKTEFILEQMRLCIATNDWIRARIISRKINSKTFTDKNLEDLKKLFYQLMIKYYDHKKQWIDVCRAYLEIYNTTSVLENEKEWMEALKAAVIFLILSPFTNEQSDLCHRVNGYKNLEKLPKYKSLLTHFLTQELMHWPKVESQYKDMLNEHDLFSRMEDSLWSVFQRRLVEHNIRVIEKYYNRITLKRLSSLLHLSPEETEDYLAELVVSKMIYAKIDRPKGIISFRPPKDASSVLDHWSQSIDDLLNLMEKTSHLVQRENMIHQIRN